MVTIQLLPQGTRVTIRRGRFPMDPSLEGRTGMILHRARESGSRYGVQLDGESRVRVFTEDEVEPRS